MPDIDPGYGGYAGTNRLLAAATNGPDVANQWAQNRLLNTANQSQQLELAHKKLGALYDVASTIMADPSAQNATSRLQDAVSTGVITPEMAQQGLGELAQLGGDPAKIKQWAFDHAQLAASYQQRIEAAGMGAPSYVSNGAQQVPVVARSGLNPSINPAGGPSIQMQQSPSELAAPRTYVDSLGVEHQTTQRGYQQAVGDPTGLGPQGGRNALSPFTAPPAAQGATPGRVIARPVGQRGLSSPTIAGPAYTSRTAGGATQGSNADGVAVAANGQPTTANPNAPNVPQGSVPGIAGPSPMLAPGRDDYRADLNNSSAKMQGVQPLLSALPLIAQLGDTGSGPGTKGFQQAKSALVSAGIIPADATDVAVRDEATKYLNQYVTRSGIAQRSDMGTLVSQQASPNLETSNAATLALTRNAIAQDRMDAARPLAYGSDDLSGYSKFKGGWTQSQDSKAYQLDIMPAADRAALVQQMQAKAKSSNPADRAAGLRFFSSLKNAMLVGARPPGAQQ